MIQRRLKLHKFDDETSNKKESISERTRRELSHEHDIDSVRDTHTESALARLSTKDKLNHLYSQGFVLETDAPYLIPGNKDRKELKSRYGEVINDPSGVVEILDNLYKV
jgi:hypothetical protein